MRTKEDQVKYYRDRADELRLLVDDMVNPESRAALLQVVGEYDALADRAAERAGG